MTATRATAIARPAPQTRLERVPWKIVWIALALRIAYMTLARTWHMQPWNHHFAFGYEMGRIARALATGYGFADPFRGHTGPTAWVAPLFPWILAGVFRLFGVYTALSAWAILAFDCVLNALIIVTIWEIALRCFNRHVAWWSAWIWALYPAAMQYAVKWVWEMTLTAFLFTCVLVVALRMRGVGEPGESDPPTAPGTGQWAVFAVLWALIALSDPTLTLFLPPCGIWILMGVPRGRVWPGQIAKATLAAVIFAASVAPWMVRNALVFHHFVPFRANFGAELYLGNGPDGNGLLMEYDHPFQDHAQLTLYRQMGELAYSKMRGREAMRVIEAKPGRFARLSLRRFYFFWFDVPHAANHKWIVDFGRNLNYQFTTLVGLFGLALALRRGRPAAGLFLWAFALLPLTYYFVSVSARFRHPLEPLIAILGVYLFQSAEKTWKVRWFHRLAA